MSGKTFQEIVEKLRSLGDPKAVEGAARFGVNVANILGVSAPALRKLAKEIGTDHRLAAQLWRTGVHDARALATLIDDPAKVTQAQMERWARDFDSWAVCDAACGSLFDKTALCLGQGRQVDPARGRVRQEGGLCPHGGPGGTRQEGAG